MFNPRRPKVGDLVRVHPQAVETWVWDANSASSGIAVVGSRPLGPSDVLVVVGLRQEPMPHDPHRTWLLVLMTDGTTGEVLSDSMQVVRSNG